MSAGYERGILCGKDRGLIEATEIVDTLFSELDPNTKFVDLYSDLQRRLLAASRAHFEKFMEVMLENCEVEPLEEVSA